MEISSVLSLCKHLIFCAIQRCRESDELCRLSIVLKPCPEFSPPLVRISDGVISITTTSLSDTEIHNFTLNLNGMISSARLTKLSSVLKDGAKFSGTEASLSTAESLNDILADISLFLRKMFIMRIPKVAVELLVESHRMPGLYSRSCVLAVECNTSTSTTTNIEHLKSGFEEYVLKHGNRLENICGSCFSTMERIKVGTGMASRSGTIKSKTQMVEAVVIISETSEQAFPSCCRPCGTRTEVLSFKDFTPCSIAQSSLDALTSMKWKDYGLTLRSVADQDDVAYLEWESLPPNVSIDIVFHHYRRENLIMPKSRNSQMDRTLTQKALKLALSELKEKNDGALLSARALKIRNYAPDLAKTIAGLILASSDPNFQEECFSILGLQIEDTEGSKVETCIKEKIISAVDLNDRKPQRSREPAAVLFSDDCFGSEYLDEEYEKDF